MPMYCVKINSGVFIPLKGHQKAIFVDLIAKNAWINGKAVRLAKKISEKHVQRPWNKIQLDQRRYRTGLEADWKHERTDLQSDDSNG